MMKMVAWYRVVQGQRQPAGVELGARHTCGKSLRGYQLYNQIFVDARYGSHWGVQSLYVCNMNASVHL